MNTVDPLPIGEVARSTGVAVSAVRYYDEIGVITASFASVANADSIQTRWDV